MLHCDGMSLSVFERCICLWSASGPAEEKRSEYSTTTSGNFALPYFVNVVFVKDHMWVRICLFTSYFTDSC